MHVTSNFAKYKNELNNRLSRIKGDIDVKKEWKFLDELSEFGYEARKAEIQEDEKIKKQFDSQSTLEPKPSLLQCNPGLP
jgi:hypothetical protein